MYCFHNFFSVLLMTYFSYGFMISYYWLTSTLFLVVTVPDCNLSGGVLATDVSWSREVCAQIIYYSEALKNLLKSQSVFILVKESLWLVAVISLC